MLRDLRREQYLNYSPPAFRLAMRRRARSWSGRVVCLFCGASRFMHDLAAAGMFTIEEDT
jgi:hypothetical protein